MVLTVTCYRCGYRRLSQARMPKTIRFKCPECGSKSFEWTQGNYVGTKKRKK